MIKEHDLVYRAAFRGVSCGCDVGTVVLSIVTPGVRGRIHYAGR